MISTQELKRRIEVANSTPRNNIFLENIKSALESANQVREHDMIRASQSSEREIYVCSKCRMQLEVIAKPIGNEIAISGHAVALVCTGEA